jgi:hypothetical protein
MLAQDLDVSKHLQRGSQQDKVTVLKLTVKEAEALPNMDVLRSQISSEHFIHAHACKLA